MPNSTGSATDYLNKLKTFRQAAYTHLGHARDALFELSDAVLLSPHVQCLAEYSQCPVFRRKWPSVYEAIQDGRPARAKLLELYLAEVRVSAGVPYVVCMGDHTAWSRPDARTLRERTVEHQPNRIPGAKPITVGQGYATLAWIPEASGSWALPLLHERIPPSATPLAQAATQLHTVVERLPTQRLLALFDAEYGCAPFVRQSAAIPCVKVARLRPNLVLATAPPPYRGHGRPAVHGRKFPKMAQPLGMCHKLRDARTWGQPTATYDTRDPQLGCVQLRLWTNLHFRKAPDVPLWVIRLERVDARGTKRDPKVLWLAWFGAPPPPLAQAWRLYFRRFAGDHWYRFAKQSLQWTLPHFKTPEQAECWSDLMPLLTWELWLARPLLCDRPLPWQKTQTIFTPGRARQSIGSVLAQIGTPTCAPKVRGKSLGWPCGKIRQRAVRHPIVKKR